MKVAPFVFTNYWLSNKIYLFLYHGVPLNDIVLYIQAYGSAELPAHLARQHRQRTVCFLVHELHCFQGHPNWREIPVHLQWMVRCWEVWQLGNSLLSHNQHFYSAWGDTYWKREHLYCSNLRSDNFQIDRLVPVAGKEQMGQFAHLFQSTSKKNLQDGHLWFSIFMRPPRSRFTRVQRVSCCVALLYLSMLVNAMWYQRTSDDTSAGLKFGPFTLTPEQVTSFREFQSTFCLQLICSFFCSFFCSKQIGVGVMSNLIVFPPSFLIIYLFRNSRRRALRESRIEKAIKEQSQDHYLLP